MAKTLVVVANTIRNAIVSARRELGLDRKTLGQIASVSGGCDAGEGMERVTFVSGDVVEINVRPRQSFQLLYSM
jgi:hypothetical protein